VTKRQADAPPFEKQIVQLPDGRELTYYWFTPSTTHPPPGAQCTERSAGAGPAGTAGGEEH
jgi:hypothetical protein